MHERLNAAEQRNKELEMLRQAEKQASDERITALQQRVDALSVQLQKIEAQCDVAQKRFEQHTHNFTYTYFHPPHCPSWEMVSSSGSTGGPNKKD